MKLFRHRTETDPAVLETIDGCRKLEAARAQGVVARYPCPVCVCPTLNDRGGYSICRVCFWEDAGGADLDRPVGANHGYTRRRAIRNVASNGTMYDADDRLRPRLLDRITVTVARNGVLHSRAALLASTDTEGFHRAAGVLEQRVQDYDRIWDLAH